MHTLDAGNLASWRRIQCHLLGTIYKTKLNLALTQSAVGLTSSLCKEHPLTDTALEERVGLPEEGPTQGWLGVGQRIQMHLDWFGCDLGFINSRKYLKSNESSSNVMCWFESAQPKSCVHI